MRCPLILEYWVMRVLLHPGPMKRQLMLKDLDPNTRAVYLKHAERGELTCLPDGCIAEPIEQFASEMDAHAHREKLQRDNPTHDYRTVLNSSLDNNEVA